MLEYNRIIIVREENKTDEEKKAEEISLKLQSKISKAISNLIDILPSH